MTLLSPVAWLETVQKLRNAQYFIFTPLRSGVFRRPSVSLENLRPTPPPASLRYVIYRQPLNSRRHSSHLHTSTVHRTLSAPARGDILARDVAVTSCDAGQLGLPVPWATQWDGNAVRVGGVSGPCARGTALSRTIAPLYERLRSWKTSGRHLRACCCKYKKDTVQLLGRVAFSFFFTHDVLPYES